MLEELTAELTAALGQQQAVEAIQGQLDLVEEELRAARDGVARREYALVLAQLERVRAEAAATQADTAGIDSDRNLLASADSARALVQAWSEAGARVAALAGMLDGGPRFDPAERDRLVAVPAEPPATLADLVTALQHSIEARDALDHRLGVLSVSKLPAPSDPLVAQLGLLDQPSLWREAERLTEAAQARQRVQVSVGGLDLDEMGPADPELIDNIEAAHAEVDAAGRAAAAAKPPGFAGVAFGVVIAVAGMAVGVPALLPVGLVISAGAAVAGILRPRARRARAVRAENAALHQAEATSYLGFHIRRVEASVDPKLRTFVEATLLEHRSALAGWFDVAGNDADIDLALALRGEIEAYNEALRSLGDTAEEIEQLRRELEEQAEPVLAAARNHVLAAIEPFALGDADLQNLSALAAGVLGQCERGTAARAQTELDEAEVDLEKAAAPLDDVLLQFGFDASQLDARVGALEQAISGATEREEARRRARPREELDAELAELQNAAAQLQRPEWATVTAADAATPDITELETRCSELLAQLTTARAEVDVDRLADRQAAVERRVAALETRHGGHDSNGDPVAIATLQQQLFAHLATAAAAGPTGDPLPVVLDEVFLRVPADRMWDLLDVLQRSAEHQQLIYLSDDAFVAAWARQKALDGTITLLELAP